MTPKLEYTTGNLNAASLILTAAAHNLEARGQALWPTSSLSPGPLLRQYPQGSWIVAWQSGRAVACCALLDTDPLFWPGDGPQEALYLHKLAVHPDVQGQGLAAALLGWAREETARRGRVAVKLDTASDRPKLRALYETCGFRPVGKRKVQGFRLTLYEMRI